MNTLVMLAMLGGAAPHTDSQRMAGVIAQTIIQEDQDFPKDEQLEALYTKSLERFNKMN